MNLSVEKKFFWETAKKQCSSPPDAKTRYNKEWKCKTMSDESNNATGVDEKTSQQNYESAMWINLIKQRGERNKDDP